MNSNEIYRSISTNFHYSFHIISIALVVFHLRFVYPSLYFLNTMSKEALKSIEFEYKAVLLFNSFSSLVSSSVVVTIYLVFLSYVIGIISYLSIFDISFDVQVSPLHLNNSRPLSSHVALLHFALSLLQPPLLDIMHCLGVLFLPPVWDFPILLRSHSFQTFSKNTSSR